MEDIYASGMKDNALNVNIEMGNIMEEKFTTIQMVPSTSNKPTIWENLLNDLSFFLRSIT